MVDLRDPAAEVDARTPLSIQSVDRASALLRLLRRDSRGQSLTCLATELGVHKSTVYRLLTSLELAGLVCRDRLTGRFQLGLEVISMAGVVLGQLDVTRIADSHVRELADATRQSVTLGVTYRHRILCVARIPGPTQATAPLWVGSQGPLHQGATGKSVLAFLDDGVIDTYLGKLAADSALSVPPALRDELREIRQQGHVVSRGAVGTAFATVSVGAPVFGHHDVVRGSLVVCAYERTLVEAQLGQLIQLTMCAASAISRQLGYDRWPVAQLP